jgi:putative transposase
MAWDAWGGMRALSAGLPRLLPDEQPLSFIGGNTRGQSFAGDAATQWGVYTHWFNRTHHRVGHVFQGRYKAILVEKDSYLLETARYVLLNPVRTGVVDDPEAWPWSSYTATIGEALAPEWLQTDWLLGQFGNRRRQAVAKYVEFVRAGVGLPSLWERLKGQIYLGSDEFVESMLRRADSGQALGEVPRVQRQPVPPPLAYFDRTLLAVFCVTGTDTLCK